MSRITEVSFTKQKVVGKYEHEIASITMAVGEGDDGAKDLMSIRSIAYQVLNSAAPSVARVSTKTVSTKPTTETKDEPAATTSAADKKKAAADKKKADAAAKKKADADKKAASAVKQEDVLKALRAYAQHHDSKDMAMQVIHDVTGVKTMKEVDKKDFAKLVKALAV